MSVCVYDHLVCRLTCTPDGHIHRLTYTRYRIDTVDSPDDGHMTAQCMYWIEINIHEKELCVKFVICKDYNETHGQQNIKMKLDLCWEVQQWITTEDWWQPSIVTKQSHMNLWCLEQSQQCRLVTFCSLVMESGWFERFWTLGNPWEFSCTSCDPTGTCQKADNSRWSTSTYQLCSTGLFWLVFTQVSQEMDTTWVAREVNTHLDTVDKQHKSRKYSLYSNERTLISF